MSKFVIECPACGRFAEAKTGFFACKKIDCAYGHIINVRTDKLTCRDCPHCGNTVVFDQSKGAATKCPVCGEPINTLAEQTNMAEFSCGQCGVRLRAAKSTASYICPVCDHVNDVAERLKSEEIQKDGLASAIKYEGDNETLVWKHPIEDFNFGSQLIVHESQEAIFFRDGQALDLFGPGRYTLETQQLPLLEKVYKLPTDTEGTFHSEVYFINKTVQMSLKWGTPDKIRFIDPLTSVLLDIGASGELNLQVSDARRLIVKLVGMQSGIAWDDRENFTRSVQNAFRPLIANAVKENLPAIIESQQIDLLVIDERSNEISALLRERMLPGFEEYGLTILQFYVTHIVLPEDVRPFRDPPYCVPPRTITGLGQMSGNGGGLGDIASLGVTLGAMGGVIGMTKEAVTPLVEQLTAPAPSVGWDCTCGKVGITSRFCPECGAKKSEVARDWDCACGHTNIMSNFCPSCGTKRPND